MDKMTEAQALRDDGSMHYNCCQAVLVPYAAACGIDREAALKLGAHFGSGMRHGATCGAVTGALMVLGMLGHGEAEATQLLREFRGKNTCLTCAELLKKAQEEGIARKCHCDGKVHDAVEIVEGLLG